jgi:hypothetical protein
VLKTNSVTKSTLGANLRLATCMIIVIAIDGAIYFSVVS